MKSKRTTLPWLRSILAGCALALALCAGAAGVATAALPPGAAEPRPDAAALLQAAGAPTCVCEEEKLELDRYVAYVAAAASAEEARERATHPSRIARRAIAMARWLAPEKSKLDATRERLADYERRVGTASTPQAVAAEMGELVRLAGANVRTSSCSYDTAEIIAIVLGFLFFIIPGIILLILFC
jgi:hypothetical protein